MLVVLSEIGLVGSSLPLECELVTPLLQVVIRRYDISGVSLVNSADTTNE